MDIRILMGLFYKVSNKQSLKDRNQIFKEVGIVFLLLKIMVLFILSLKLLGMDNTTIL